MIPLLATTENLDWATLIMGVLGGLALFLFGMDQMTRALRVVAGAGMRQFLGKLTTNPVKGVMAGALTTAVIQSSSVTTVLVIGFVSAGLMTLSQAIGVIMGANVGTTITGLSTPETQGDATLPTHTPRECGFHLAVAT